MRTISILSLTAFTMFTHMACVAPTATDEAVAASQDRLEDEMPPNDGMTEADAVTQESLAAAEDRVSGFKDVPSLTAAEKAAILDKYSAVPHDGIRTALYEKAILYYDTNLEHVPNKRWLSVIDFSVHSKNDRFFIMDMEGGPVRSYVIAHGKYSDPNDTGKATLFGNVEGSGQSSVGYYLTAETYIGGNGRSLRLDGLSSTNSNVRERLVVIHGANYVEDGRAKQGRSLGCPAFSHSVVQGLIDELQRGSLIYAMN